LKTRTSSDREADALAARGRKQNVVRIGADRDVGDGLAFGELHRDDARRRMSTKSESALRRTPPAVVANMT
jgi:hypothetical protein